MRTGVGGRVVDMFRDGKMRASFHFLSSVQGIIALSGILFDTDAVDSHSLLPPTI